MGRAFYDKQGHPYRMLGLVLDITKRKKDEEALKQSVRMRDDFMLIAAHELRTPVTPLSMQLHLLKKFIHRLVSESSSQSESLIQLLEQSIQQVFQISALIDNLLNFSKSQFEPITLNLETFNLNELILGVIQDLQSDINSSNYKIELHLEENIFGRWDRNRIRQVVISLIQNALKYGTGKPIEVSVSHLKKNAEFTIRDHGIGIMKEDQKRIFRRHERAVSVYSYGGFGMGLYIARQIIKAHGGNIWVKSELGAGAAFTIKLPIGT